ncbi:ABC transporter ATP-binding protein [Anoxybacillus rupiensis]|uniref:ABC transporter ATP-binding protein n=1 Tax=Anoxybacteroides rupiense TaxID=311460 RepID=A0ABD5IVF1_9BACL|nr:MULTISPECIES: ABC transporter ATP-binding protein [Anoxybacillus]MDE8563780.1 ABC transporter ATP-binding protein [Anoxybacillus rupiensis]MED5051376.1 ABC transporter ATP-binding protein [Anoxybacillus rupiensis]
MMGVKENKRSVKENAQTLRRIWGFLEHQKGRLAVVIVMVMISSGLSLLGPYIVGRAVDTYIIAKRTDGFWMVVVALLLIYLALSLSSFLQSYWMIGIAQKTIYAIRTELFGQFHQLPISFFNQRQSGELMSRLTNDIDNMSQTFNSTVIQVISSTLTLIGAVVVMLLLSPLLTAVTLLIVPIMYGSMKWITNRTQKRFKEQQRNLGELNGFIEEVISGQKVVKLFSQEKKMIAQFLEKSEQLKQSGFWAQTYSGFIPKLMNVLNNMSFALIAGVGGIFAFKGMISIGTIVIFSEYARQFTRPLNDLANQWNTFLSALAGAERVFEIIDQDKEEDDEAEAIDLPAVRGNVEFRNVSFSYDQKRKAIQNVNFSVTEGETVALVGPTGVGKTTIIQLLMRFYDPDHGQILIDGIDTRRVKRSSLRSQMAFVLQDPFLFQGTIRENIRYGRLEATDEEVVEAAKWANAHSFITKLPKGYDTVLQPDGSGISQGQKQLLAIARAMIAKPSILILDEATSNIDTMTELMIQEALERLMEKRTCFVIAHRLNTIQQADRILVLREGTVVEQGTHDSLLKEKGFYSELYYRQFKKDAI